MRKRSIISGILLSILTCGIYNLFWVSMLQNDLNYETGDREASGGATVLFIILTCGIYGLFWAYKMGQRFSRLRNERNLYPRDNSVLFLVASIFLGIIGTALIQDEMNNIIDELNYA